MEPLETGWHAAVRGDTVPLRLAEAALQDATAAERARAALVLAVSLLHDDRPLPAKLNALAAREGPMDRRTAAEIATIAWRIDGEAETDLGAYDAALRSLRRAKRSCKQCFGVDGLPYAVILNSLGIACKYRGEFQEAEDCYRRAGEIFDAHGAGVAMRAGLLHNLAGLEHSRGRLEAALAAADAGIAMRGEQEDDQSLDLALDRVARGAILADLGRNGAAAAELRSALPLLSDELGGSSAKLAVARHNLGTALFNGGYPSEAAAEFAAALDIHRSAHGEDHPQTAAAQVALAYCQHMGGDREGALRTLGGADRLLETTPLGAWATEVAQRLRAGVTPRKPARQTRSRDPQ